VLGGGVKVRLAAKNSLRESGPPSKLAGTVDKAKDGPKVISPSLNWMIMLELIGARNQFRHVAPTLLLWFPV